MINEERVQLMIDMTRFETGDKGRDALQTHKYYRNDFLALALIKSFFLTTIGYVLVLGIFFLANIAFFMDNFNLINIRVVGSLIVIGYIVLLGLFMAISYIHAMVHYDRARKLLKEYQAKLDKLSNM